MAYYGLKNYDTFYKGGYSSLNPDYGNFTGYRMPATNISSPTSIQTANQLSEVISRIKEGVKNVELQFIQPDIFEQVPKQHFAEIRALMKLSGVRPSIHAPLIDPAGFGQKGYEGDDAREDSERRLFSVIEKARELDTKGNIPVVIHSSAGIPGASYRPGDEKKGEERFHEKALVLINKENPSQMVPVEEERKYYLGSTTPEEFALGNKDIEKGGTLMTAQEGIESINSNEWRAKLSGVLMSKKEADKILYHVSSTPLAQDMMSRKPIAPDQYPDAQKQELEQNLQKTKLFLDQSRTQFSGLFDKAYRYGTDEQKTKLRELAKQYQKEQDARQENYKNKGTDQISVILNESQTMDVYLDQMEKLTANRDPITGKIDERFGAPKIYVSAEEFAMEKAAQTFGNLASKSYEKWKGDAPVIAVENMYQGFAFSKADDMKKLVEESKKVFVKNMVKKGFSEGVAKTQADKLLGVTWDVGHLNMMRKAGFNEKDVVSETKKIAKLVKHVHLTDNFGYSDSHLPPGMGNVPTKEILEQLEKAGSLKNARTVVEAGGFFQHFKRSPFPWVLGAFGAGVYGANSAPYFNQAQDMMGNYMGSPMAYLPEKHFSMYGTGLGMLPTELGGQIPGGASRFSGTPNA